MNSLIRYIRLLMTGALSKRSLISVWIRVSAADTANQAGTSNQTPIFFRSPKLFQSLT